MTVLDFSDSDPAPAPAPTERLAPLPKRASRRDGEDAPALSGAPDEVVIELLERAAVLLSTLKQDVSHLEVDRDAEARRIEDERRRRREAAEKALGELVDLKARAGEIAKRKDKTLVLDLAMAGPIPDVDSSLSFDTVAAELAQEVRAAKGITGAMRLNRIGELLKLATAIVSQMVSDADKTKEQLLEEANAELRAESKEAEASFEIGSGILERDLGLLEEYLPLSARDWSSPDWAGWAPPTDVADTLRMGAHVHPTLPGSIPLVRPFPLESGLLIEARAHRDEAVRGVQSIVLRMIAALPPGGLRLTLIDPKGFGESVAPLLALGEDDPHLIDGGVASTPDDIDEKLAGLSRHVEHVISHHLRGRHPSLSALTGELGQIVEPFRCVVVFDHPTGLSAQALQQLHSLMETGSRSGVMTIVVRDARPSLYLPDGGRIMVPTAVDRLDSDDAGFFVEVPDAGRWLVRLDTPPDGELTARLVAETAHQAGRRHEAALDLPALAALESAAHQVRGSGTGPVVDPHDRSTWWTASAADGIAVPLGRAGPAAVEVLELDGTTRTGALVAGGARTGVSNLLLAFALGAAMRYPPAELQLYLLGLDGADDLAPFAAHHLPHAALVAVDAPRELGTSVLAQLDVEVERRQELLRNLDLQHEGYVGYRRTHEEPLPRIVLVADRFGALLANRDRTAEQAAEQLDRLARFGPHVGVHLVLGTPTADRAALVTRALVNLRTRVVLSASEDESELLLGIGNDGAALLGQAGDAIASTTLSDPAGNRHFRAVLLRPTELDICLGDLRRRADEDGLDQRRPQVIDGGAIARLEQRPPGALVGDRQHRYDRLLPRLWLGEPLAMADPVEALVRRQDGANLLVVADDPAVGQGVLLSAVTSACLVHGSAVTTLVLDFMPLEEGASEVAKLLATRWPVQLTRRRSMTKVLDAVHCVIQDRLAHEAYTAPPVLFVINGLGRAREFDVSPGDAADHGPLDPTHLLETIVHDGPEVGVHTLMWCDSVSLLNRRTTPGTVREFALRVAGPMNEDHSLALVDSEVAASLSPNQAVFYDEDYGRLTRFRPYALPSIPWLDGLVAPPESPADRPPGSEAPAPSLLP